MNPNPGYAIPAALLSCATLFPLAQAAEEGGSTYAAGAANFLVAAVPPPPGTVTLGYGTAYRAERFLDASGKELPIPGFKLSVDAISPRFIWNMEGNVLGGNPILHLVLPILSKRVSLGGSHQAKHGLGDIVFGVALAFHHGDRGHSVLALDVVAPTGDYKAGDLANLGRNHWSLQPQYLYTRVSPDGLNLDVKSVLNLNRRNPATNYRSGTELIIDYAIGWGLGKGWVAGIGGSLLEQLRDDRLGGVRIPDSRSRMFAIGPSVRYQSVEGAFITLKWQRELSVRNRAEGSAFWLVASLPI